LDIRLMPFNPFSALTSKVFGGLLILSLLTLGPALLLTRHRLADVKAQLLELTEWRGAVIATVRVASGNEDVTAKTAVAQIRELGVIRVQLKQAVESQNGQIEAMARESEAALELAAQAERDRRAATRRAEALKAELRSRARAPVPAADMEAAVRQSQDELYDEGL
jgi:hypothetical protein